MRFSIALVAMCLPSYLLGCSQKAAAPATPAVSALPPEEPAQEQTVQPEASKADPEKAAALVEEGRRIQQEQGEDGAEAAIAKYRAALAADPAHVAAYWELGWSLQVLGRFDEAVEAWDEVARLAPEHPELPDHFPVLKMRRDAAAALASLPDTATLPEREEAPRPGPTLRINAVGDIQMGRAWPEESAALPDDNGRPLFAHVRTILQDADITFGNLETVLADGGESSKCRKGSKVCYAFRAPTAFTESLVDAGFDVLSIANNHTGDFGEAGRQATIDVLDAAGLLHSGPVGDLASWEVNGLKVGLVGFSSGAGLYQIQDIDTARKVVADLKRRHDIVIVSYHGGAEGAKATRVPKEVEIFFGENRGDVYAFSRAMVDAGADLVLGHGPHVLRAMEIYRGRLIAYSLGNFSAWTGFNLSGPLGLSAILHVTLAPNGVALDAKLTPVAIDQPGVPRPDPKKRGIDIVRRLSKEDVGSPLFDANGQWRRPEPQATN